MNSTEPQGDKPHDSDRDDAPTTDDRDIRTDGGVEMDASGASAAQPAPDASADADGDDGADLDEPFTVTASGPVRYRRGFEDGVVETHEITVDIEREIATVEEFDRFYELHESITARADAINILTEDRAGYCITRGETREWSVEIDGPVAAYRSAAEDRSYHKRLSYRHLTKNCVFSNLFGPGAHVAQLDCQRAAGNSLDEYLRDFGDELEAADD